MYLSIILPIKDESPSIEKLHKEIQAAMEREKVSSYEVLFVDDGSKDESYQKAAHLAQRDSHVRAIGFRRTAGKAAALAEGIRQATGDILITMDGDGQDDPNDIHLFLDILGDKSIDLVSGWKVRRQDPWPRVLWSRVFNAVLRLVFKIELHDMNCGFKAFRAQVAKEMHLYGDLHRFIPVLAACAGYRVTEVPVNHRPREYGKSKYGLSRIFMAPLDLITVLFLTHFMVRPLHLFGGIGMVSSTAGLLICAHLTLGWMVQRWHIGDRPLIFLGILLLILGVQLFSIGLVCEMTIRATRGPLRTQPALRSRDEDPQDPSDANTQ